MRKEGRYVSAAFQPTRMRISIDRYQRMVSTGVLTKDDRVELIEGEIIDMASIGKIHAAIVSQLQELFVTGLGGRANVVTGGPIDLGGFSEPQSDLMLLKRRDDFYRGKTPEAVDALLVVEVSDSSLNFDLGKKLGLYARYGVAEYWVVDVASKCVFVQRSPDQERYADTSEMRGANLLVPLAFPELSIAVR